MIVTNTLPIRPEQEFDKLTVLSIAPLLAQAIKEVFEDGSVTSLFAGRSCAIANFRRRCAARRSRRESCADHGRAVLRQPGEAGPRSRVSPRAAGRCRRLATPASAAAGEPAQPASAARSVLRRWANAASITANTSPGARRRSRRRVAREPHQPRVDVRHRPEHRARHRAGPAWPRAYQASLTLGTP